MLEWLTSQGWTVDWSSKRCPPGFIEFRRKVGETMETFWRATLLEAYEFLEGP